MSTIKEWVKQVVIEYVKKQFTYDNFSDCLKKIVATLSEKAKSTENVIDDYVVSYLEFVVADEEKIKVFYDYVSKFVLSDTTDGVVQAEPVDVEVKAILFETGQCEQVVTEESYQNLVGFTSIVFVETANWMREEMGK